MDGRYRNWCITSWKIPDVEVGKMTYLIYQPEKCPKTLKEHFQGYCEFTDKISMKQLKEYFKDDSMHIEPRYGTQQQAIDYCRKLESNNGNVVIMGKPKGQGNRSDLDSLWEAVESGMKAKEILHEFQGKAMKYINMIKQCIEIEHDCYMMDKIIDQGRDIKRMQDEQLDKCPEVEGNTEPSTLGKEIEIKKKLLKKEKDETLKESYKKFKR